MSLLPGTTLASEASHRLTGSSAAFWWVSLLRGWKKDLQTDKRLRHPQQSQNRQTKTGQTRRQSPLRRANLIRKQVGPCFLNGSNEGGRLVGSDVSKTWAVQAFPMYLSYSLTTFRRPLQQKQPLGRLTRCSAASCFQMITLLL